MQFFKKKKVGIVVFVLFIGGIALGLVSARLLMVKFPKLLCRRICQNTITENKEFYSDDVILSGKTSSGEPVLIYLSLNRKKIGSQFSHYYFGNYIYKGVRKKLYTSFLRESPIVSSNGFLKSYIDKPADDLSSRESVDLQFKDGSFTAFVHIDNLKGDFIEKNSLEYTKYSSVGEGKITSNTETTSVYSYLEKSYSADYSKYIFFDGFDSLKSLAQFFVFWDSQGNFYLLDSSAVNPEFKDYKSHTWALYKNKAGDFTKKAFFANVKVEQLNFRPKKWIIEIPEFNFQFNLTSEGAFAGDGLEGIVEGAVVSPSNFLNVRGYFSYHKYGN